MHIADQERGNLGANAIVAGSTGIATGAALSSKMRGTDQVTVCFFGDGALGQGVLYEVMNIASLWKLPVIYVCENNLYNEYTHNSETTAGEISARARAFGILTEEVDGQDIRMVYATAQRLVALATEWMKAVEFDYGCMQASAEAGYMNAFAAATYLAERGVPFRSAHEIVGKAVQRCLEKGCELQDLPLDELKRFSSAFEPDIYQRLTISSVLAVHDVPGGTAPEQVMQALSKAKQRIAAIRGVVHAHA